LHERMIKLKRDRELPGSPPAAHSLRSNRRGARPRCRDR
jgi:hypothetical protein